MSKKRYHKYYQWVAFVLLLEAGIFYLPRYIWRNCERGLVRVLVGNLTEPLLDDTSKAEGIAKVVKYYTAHKGMHGGFAAA